MGHMLLSEYKTEYMLVLTNVWVCTSIYLTHFINSHTAIIHMEKHKWYIERVY
jgi:hypothetical protein